MNFFHHKDLGNNLLQLCPKVVKHPVYVLCVLCVYVCMYHVCMCKCMYVCMLVCVYVVCMYIRIMYVCTAVCLRFNY